MEELFGGDALEGLGYVYIAHYNEETGKEEIYYLKSLDGSGEITVTSELEKAKRYLQQDLLMHDLCILQYMFPKDSVLCKHPYGV